jgi:hypothetical protein
MASFYTSIRCKIKSIQKASANMWKISVDPGGMAPPDLSMDSGSAIDTASPPDFLKSAYKYLLLRVDSDLSSHTTKRRPNNRYDNYHIHFCLPTADQ